MAPQPAGAPWMFSLLESSDGFVTGSIRGWGNETRVRFGKDWGFTLGTFNFNTFGGGMDFFRYRGIPLDALSGGLFKVYVLLPNLDVRVYGGSDRFAGVIGTSATGLRLANCAVTGCFEASLRVLTVDLWEATDFQQASFAVSLGGNVTVGIKL